MPTPTLTASRPHNYAHAAMVVDGVYIGDIAAAADPVWLHSHGIDYVVNVSGIRYRHILPTACIDIEDATVTACTHAAYTRAFSDCASIIARERAAGKRVLVHCMAGINRSATAIAFYLADAGYGFDDTVAALTAANATRRTPVLTNASFRRMIRMRSVSPVRRYPGYT